MSQSFFKYETQEEILERIKRLRVEMLKNRLREARHFMDNQQEELNSNAGDSMMNKERDYSLSDSANSDVIGEAMSYTGKVSASSFASDRGNRDRLDLSAYLKADREFQGEGAKRLKEILSRVDDRALDSDRAREEYARLIQSVEEITGNDRIDIEHKLNMVEQRVTIYIENRNYDNSALDEDLLMDYKALCILLGVDEQVLSVDELRSKVDEMLEEYSSKSHKEIVAEMVNEALVSLGMRVDGCCVLDGQMDGELYSSDDGNKCKVFVSCNDSGIMIEPVNADESASADEVITAQKKVCAAEKNLMDEAKKSGIILKKIYSKEHSPLEMATESDLVFDSEYAGQAVNNGTERNITEHGGENEFERMRSYNRMRRSRRKAEKAREMRYE